MTKPSVHITFRVPADWRDALEQFANSNDQTLAEFVVESALDRLPMGVRKKLSKKRKPHRPKTKGTK